MEKGMSSRDRVRKAIRFQRPDRVPISHAILPAAQIKYGDPLAKILVDFRDDFGWDMMSDLPLSEYPALYLKGDNEDAFGTVWHSNWLGICGIPLKCPIMDLKSYGAYKWPADFTAGPPSGRLYSGHMVGFEERWYSRGAWITYFEQLQQLRGMENFMMDLSDELPEFYHLIDDLLQFNLRWIDKWCAMDYDGIHFADDWGEQRGMLVSPKIWRRIFKPRYAQMFARCHEAGKDVWFHTDGKINAIFLDLIEIGVDVINAQVGVIGHDWISQNVRGKVAFRTDIDRQHVMPFGTPTEVREEVRKVFQACGTPQGGIVACGEVGPDVPLENVRAMYEAFLEFGSYSK